jgi:hypothetical protein
MKFKNQGFPTSNLALAHFTSQFTASLGMFLGVPDYSIAFMEFKSGPWIGFACAYSAKFADGMTQIFLQLVFKTFHYIRNRAHSYFVTLLGIRCRKNSIHSRGLQNKTRLG